MYTQCSITELNLYSRIWFYIYYYEAEICIYFDIKAQPFIFNVSFHMQFLRTYSGLVKFLLAVIMIS